jgi:GNAT superfamily N-acetyltransferase
VFGYYAISTYQLETETLPRRAKKGLPTRMPLPAVLLGKLAVDRATQGQKLGSLLLMDALRRVQHLAGQVGIRLVIVDAIDESARRFYLHYRFESLEDNPDRLFMSVSVIRQLGLVPLSEAEAE